MAELVSPCCGAEYEDTIDEEGYEVYKCLHTYTKRDGTKVDCAELFNEPIEDYEYDAQIRESIAEDRMDEKRLGL